MTAIAYKLVKGAFVPLGRFRREVDASFKEGSIYHLAEVKGRSAASHSHYFACLHEAWLNLPEPMALHFPNEEAMRKFALIRTGWADRRSVSCGTKAAAERVAAFIRGGSGFSVVTIEGTAITQWTARSQSMAEMGADDFQKSKSDVLEFLEDVIQVSKGSLMKKVTDK